VPVRTDGAVTAPRDDGQQLARRLRDLEYPELRRRDPREIAVLQRRVDARETLYKMVKTMHDEGVSGGRAIDVVTAGYHLAVARADLAWARQNVREAVARLAEAADFAAEVVEISTTLYEQGMGHLGAVLEAQTLLADAELALLRAEKVAAAANVDISDIETDPGKRVRERPSPGPGVEPPPPGLDVPAPPGWEPLPPGLDVPFLPGLEPLPPLEPEPFPAPGLQPQPPGLPAEGTEEPRLEPLPVPQPMPALPVRPKKEERPQPLTPPST